jgi:two-component system, NarL family, nitrate/nitrite sensor histidine kinase NarX
VRKAFRVQQVGSGRGGTAAVPGTSRPETVNGRILRLLWAAGLALPLLLLAASLLLALGIAALHVTEGGHHTVEAGVVVGCLLAAVLALFAMARQLRRQVLEPLVRLETSVSRVCQGEPGAALITTDTGVLGAMARDIDSLSQEVHGLYEDMDSRVARQTARLAQKTASLKILYDVAATINQADDLEALLLRFLRTLKEMVNGRAATVRLQAPDGRMQLVGCIGLDDRVQLEREVVPIHLCVCGKALTPGDILCEGDPATCAARNGRPMFGTDVVEALLVPLAYHDEALGSYTIYVDCPGITGREDIRELLATIGQHLGIAVAKQRSDAEARRLSIIEERNALAHELHDSLAQTLASLRFQVRMLGDTLQQGGSPQSAMDDLSRIRNGLDEAHTELRELLNSFRAPLDRRGLVPALEQLTEHFARDTGMHVFFQKDCRAPSLPAADEMQLLRIVQEALNNVRKHSRAQTVRVLLNCRPGGAYMLLVEDDGVGFDLPRRTGRPGEHIGLSIMEERARRLGGQLRIESEPGEGTRVEVAYNRREPPQGPRRVRVD